MFECFDELRGTFVPRGIELVGVWGGVVGCGDDEEGGAFEEDDFGCAACFCEGG